MKIKINAKDIKWHQEQDFVYIEAPISAIHWLQYSRPEEYEIMLDRCVNNASYIDQDGNEIYISGIDDEEE